MAERGSLANGVYVKTLARAALIAGGVDALAEKLGVTPTTLAGWLRGDYLPTDVFLRAVDIVVEDSTRPEVILKHSNETLNP